MGLEAYIYVWGRMWELLGASDQPPWETADPAADSRLHELKDMTRWLDMWREYNLTSVATQHLKMVAP